MENEKSVAFKQDDAKNEDIFVQINKFKPLEQKELQLVDKLKKDFNFKDSVSLVKFADSIESKISSFDNEVFQNIKIKDTGEAGQIINNMLSEMDKFDTKKLPTDKNILAKLPIIGDILYISLKKFIGNLDTVESKINELGDALSNQKYVIEGDIKMLDSAYDQNLKLIRELEVFIVAATQISKEAKETELRQLKEKADQTGDILDSQLYSDFKQKLERFDKKIYNLILARAASVQMAPQIRIAQESDNMLIEDIKSVIDYTLRIWKSQFIMVISNQKREKALKITRGIKDATNKQMEKNAEALEQLTGEIQKNYERGVIDLETLEKVNQHTISTIKNRLQSQMETVNKRKEAINKLNQIENELKNTLIEAVKQEQS